MGLKNDVTTILEGSRRITSRPGVVGDLVLFAPTTIPIFTVVGGDIWVHALYAKVTTVIQANATTITLSHTTAISATVVPLAGAGVNITGSDLDSLITITGAVAVAPTLYNGAARGVGIPNITNTQILVPGSIGMVVGGATNTGLLLWTIVWSPMSESAQVNPA